jgi:hypothetical protein
MGVPFFFPRWSPVRHERVESATGFERIMECSSGRWNMCTVQHGHSNWSISYLRRASLGGAEVRPRSEHLERLLRSGGWPRFARVSLSLACACARLASSGACISLSRGCYLVQFKQGIFHRCGLNFHCSLEITGLTFNFFLESVIYASKEA